MAKYGQGEASFLAAGGEEGVRQLVDAFYVQMETLEEGKEIRAMHRDDLSMITDKLTLFLTGWLGGPRQYGEKYGRISIPMVHRHLDIKEKERDAWLFCMNEALKKQDYDEDFKTYLIGVLAFPAERIRQVSQSARSEG